METFGQRVKRLRAERKLSQRGLADRSGLHFGSIAKIERDERRDVQEATVDALARGLGVSREALTSQVAILPGTRADIRDRRRKSERNALDEALAGATGIVANEAELRALAQFPAGKRLSAAEWSAMMRMHSDTRAARPRRAASKKT